MDLIVKNIEVYKKTWGREEWLTNSQLYCGKLLYVEKSRFCSLHFHIKKTEDFHILKGSIKLDYIYRDEYNIKPIETIILKQGETIHIPQYLAHRFTGLEDRNVLIEISTEHFEDDSYRLEPSSHFI